MPEVDLFLPEVDLLLPKVDLRLPEVDLRLPEVDLPGPKVDLRLPEVDLLLPEVDLPGREVDFLRREVDLPGREVDLFLPEVDLPGPEVDLLGHEVDLRLPEVDLRLPKVDLPEREVDLLLPEVDLPGPKVDPTLSNATRRDARSTWVQAPIAGGASFGRPHGTRSAMSKPVSSLVRSVVIVAAVHFAVVAVHGLAHLALGVLPDSVADGIFIGVVIYLDLALTYLARVATSETVLACLQELPNPLPPSVDPATLGAAGLGAAAPALAQRRALFVHSANVACVGSWNVAEDRMQIAQWRLSSGTEFFAAGIHAIDRRNYSVTEVRGAYAALTRHALDERWGNGIPLLMLGDFNAWPDLPEVGARACFFGVSSSYEHRPGNETFFGRKSPPLYRIEPSPGVPLGTYFDAETSCWRDIDHVYVSEALRPGAQARRLDTIGQKSLVTRNGRPSGSRLSDHLPVEARVALT